MATHSNHHRTMASAEHTRVALVPIGKQGMTMDMFNNSNDLKKTYSVRLGQGESFPLRMEMVYCFFDIPLREAARIMRVSVSLMKKIRTWVKVDQWPCSLIHGGDYAQFGLTKDEVIKGRDDVISGLESECLACPSHELDGLKLALKVMKETRDYATLYASLVIPTTGRRPPEKVVGAKRIKRECEGVSTVREILDSIQPRQAERKTKLTSVTTKVVTTVETIVKTTVETTVETESDDFWPIAQEFNFSNFDVEVEDELGLGPCALTFTTSVVVGLGN